MGIYGVRVQWIKMRNSAFPFIKTIINGRILIKRIGR